MMTTTWTNAEGTGYAVRTYTTCRVCDGPLRLVLDLGPVRVSAFPLPGEPDSLLAPLTLMRCGNCHLVQLHDAVDPALLYQEYWYRSGVNETMVAELRDVVEHAITWVQGLSDDDTVVDIGANDGTLLGMYPGKDLMPALRRIAYEPAWTFMTPLLQVADIVVPWAFPITAPGGYRTPSACAKIVTSIACFYDLNHPVAFAEEVARILRKEGVWIIQLQDLHQMIEATAFDNICHEHVTYLSVEAIEQIVARAGLQVVHVEPRRINGGSVRVYVMHQGMRDRSLATVEWLAKEAGCAGPARLDAFADAVQRRIVQIREVVGYAKSQGATIDLYAASTKANTLLQAAGLGRDQIRQAWERSPEKWGRETVGGRIPIVGEAEGRATPPDFLLIGAWQFADAFLQREAAYLAGGGQVILPLPAVEVVGA